MNVLIACEFSGVVRRAFKERGHNVYSCDLLPARDGEKQYHIEGDILTLLKEGIDGIPSNWDLIIAHPPCTYLTVAGNRWYSSKPELIDEAVNFAKSFWDYADKVCIENPIGRLSTRWRKPDQIINPWMFGHPERKSTCLWLKNLPKLEETNNVKEEMLKLPKKEQNKIHYMSPSKDRGYLRSITYEGIAKAMAEQWG